MENATKALIMAGAILIAILLIGVGILILRSTSGMEGHVDSVSSAMEVKTFNSQFEQYIGNNIPAVQVKSLISTVKASNARNTSSANGRVRSVTIKLTGAIGREVSISDINAPYYNVSIPTSNGYDADGYIQIITLTANGTGLQRKD